MNLALTLFSSALLILIFPRFGWTWLAPVALAPIIFACARETSWKRRFLYGWLGGAIFWGAVCYWIQFVLEVHASMGFWGGWGTFLLFALFKGLHLGVFALLAGFAVRVRWLALPAIAALWTGLERTHGPLGFAWVDLGNAAIDMPAILGLAPMIGVYGMSFVYAMTACAVALSLMKRRVELAWLLLLAILLFVPDLPDAVRPTQSALVVQPNVDTEQAWTETSLRELEERLLLLSRAPDSDLVVWPETPAPFYPDEEPFRQYMNNVAERAGTHFLMGGVGRTPSGGFLNSAYLLRPDGSIIDRYDKVNLVPFGEFVPPFFSFVNRVSHEAGDFTPGGRIVTFPLNGHTIGAFICYESAFPDLVRQFVLNGAHFLVNLSNDGYFGGGAAREQHLQIARMRAVENHRWILRATNDGITAMIDPSGRITDTLPSYQSFASKMEFSFRSDITPYTQHGDWFAWGCLILGLGSSVYGWRVKP